MRTRTGRVVYHRKPHLFKYSDALRILRKIEVEPVAVSLESGRQAVAAASAAIEVIEDLANFVARFGISLLTSGALESLVKSLLKFLLMIAAKGSPALTSLILSAFAPEAPPEKESSNGEATGLLLQQSVRDGD